MKQEQQLYDYQTGCVISCKTHEFENKIYYDQTCIHCGKGERKEIKKQHMEKSDLACRIILDGVFQCLKTGNLYRLRNQKATIISLDYGGVAMPNDEEIFILLFVRLNKHGLIRDILAK